MKIDNVEAVKVGGQLRKHFEFWSQICNDRYILKQIMGASIPFIEGSKIIQRKLPHQIKMTKEQECFVDAEIQKLLDTNCIKEIKQPLKKGWISNIFLVPKKDGGYRLILNLKGLNKHIKYQKFKMENIENLAQMLRPLDWLCSVDIKSAYSHLPMSKRYFPYLQFSWKNRHFYYSSLPFGIANGPILFVRVTKGIMNFL